MKTAGKLIDDVVQALVNEASPEKIILFGSRSRGDASADSDVDLLVVESGEFGIHNSRRKELARLSKAVAGFPFSIDILLYSHDEVERWRNSLNNVAASAVREGTVMYERH